MSRTTTFQRYLIAWTLAHKTAVSNSQSTPARAGFGPLLGAAKTTRALSPGRDTQTLMVKAEIILFREEGARSDT